MFDAADELTFHQKLFTQLHKRLEAAGFSIVFFASDNNPEKQSSQLAQIASDSSLSGCIVWSILTDALAAETLSKIPKSFPLVILDKYYKGVEHDKAVYDNCGAGEALAKLLLSEGIRSFVWLEEASDRKWSSIIDRRNGFKDALGKASSMKIVDISAGKLPKLGKNCALVASTGRCAKLLAERGVKTPDNIALSAFLTENDLEMDKTGIFNPFTKIIFDSEELAREALGILLEKINGEKNRVLSGLAPWRVIDPGPRR